VDDDPEVFIESHNCMVRTCEVFDTAGHGVYVGDEFNRRDESWPLQPSNSQPDPHTGNTVINSKINNFGVIWKDSVGIYLGHGRDALISRNEISHGNWSGISVGTLQNRHWVSGTTQPANPSCLPGNPNATGTCEPAGVVMPPSGEATRIMRNKVHRVMLKTNDGGGIYMQGSHIVSEASSISSILFGNYVHDIVINPYTQHQVQNSIGFYFEKGSSDWTVRNNYLARVQRLFNFGYHLRPVLDQNWSIIACQHQPSIWDCQDGGKNKFLASPWPLDWEECCQNCPPNQTCDLAQKFLFRGQDWSVNWPNYWWEPTSASSGAYALYSHGKGYAAGMGNGMQSITGTSAANILVNPSTISTYAAEIDAIIGDAGPLAASQPWFFPNVVRRIHRLPLCEDDGEDLDDHMQ
jgi:hypothetical protein